MSEEDKKWMAVYTKPRNEKKVADRLTKAGVENYLPMHEQLRKWSDRYKKVKVPIISSYVFVKVAETERSLVLQDHGVLNFVFWLGKPALLKEEEINRIKYFLKEAGPTDEIRVESIEKGEDVIVSAGPFQGERGFVQSSGGKTYSIILYGLGVQITLSKLNIEREK